MRFFRTPKECNCTTCEIFWYIRENHHENFFVKFMHEHMRLYLLFSIICSIGLYKLQLALNLYPNFLISIFGVICFIGGSLVDEYATYINHKVKEKYDVKRLHFPVVEINPFLPLNPKGKDILFNLTNLGVLLLIPFAYIFPSLGVVGGFSRMLAGMSNLECRECAIATLNILQKHKFVVVKNTE